jgi:UDP-2,3-diacylglucosamine pyrophosphatase LpxH
MIADDDLIAAFREHGSNRKVAAALGLDIRTVERRRSRLALKGWSPDHDMTRTVPDGFAVKGTSTLYREDGSIAAQWVKSTADTDRREAIMREAIAAAADFVPVAPKRKTVPGKYRDDLLVTYPIGDPHIGMLAWAKECGADWDIEIAKRTHQLVVADLVSRSPQTEQALIVNLGDLMHYDSMAAVTPRGGNNLDADGRYNRMLHAAADVMIQCVESALDRHKRVHVVNAIGNHDETGAQAIALVLKHRFHREPRVTVDTSPSVFNYYRWGANLIGVHHGHTCKPDVLPGVMATDRAKDWGETLHRYWYMGHIHHASMKEYPGVTVESFGTLAAKDAYATAGGWRAKETMKAIILHRDHGEAARTTSSPAMVGA